MDIQDLMPPAALLQDFESLQLSISEDKSGQKTKGLVTYFKEASSKSATLSRQSTDYETKLHANMLGEALGAAQRILVTAWEEAHGSALNV
jgi:hypothetical protein